MEASLAQAADHLAGVLFGGGFTVLSACLLGRIALGQSLAIQARLTVAEGWLLAFGVGSAALSTIVLALCALQLLNDASILLTGAAVAACWARWGRWSQVPLQMAPCFDKRIQRILLLLPVAVYGCLYLVHTLAPETRADAMGYHLGLVQRYYRHGGFVAITTNVYAQLSQGAEMLYLFAYGLGRESGAKLVHFSFLCATVGGLLCLARRLKAPAAGIFAAVAYFTCPVVIPAATSAYNDCALAFYLLATFCVLTLWWKHDDTGWLWVLGALIGFCVAIKYTGVVAVLAAAACSVRSWRLNGGLRPIQALLIVGGAAAAFGMPWLVKNAVITGNPLAPFFNAWFPNPYVSVEWENAYRFAMRAYQEGPFDRWTQLLAAPFELVHGQRYAGSIGWISLLVPVALIAWRRPATKYLLAAAVVCALPWLSNAGARFLMATLMFLFLAVGLALEAAPAKVRYGLLSILLLLQSFSSWPALKSYWYYPGLWSVEGFPWEAALGVEPQKWHLARNVKHFLITDQLDRITTAKSRVLSLGNLPEAYLGAELLVSHQGLENQDLTDVLLDSIDPLERPGGTLRVEWPSLQLRGLRVVRDAPAPGGPWRVSELLVLRSGESVNPTSLWRASAEPMPWHADRLIDGNRFMPWNARESPSAGMLLQVNFGEVINVEGVEVIHPVATVRQQEGLAFEGLLASGQWTRITTQSRTHTTRRIEPSVARSAAAAKLRSHRIDYVVLFLDAQGANYPQARIIASNPRSWGLEKVFVDRGATLYSVLPAPP